MRLAYVKYIALDSSLLSTRPRLSLPSLDLAQDVLEVFNREDVLVSSFSGCLVGEAVDRAREGESAAERVELGRSCGGRCGRERREHGKGVLCGRDMQSGGRD